MSLIKFFFLKTAECLILFSTVESRFFQTSRGSENWFEYWEFIVLRGCSRSSFYWSFCGNIYYFVIAFRRDSCKQDKLSSRYVPSVQLCFYVG